LGKQKKLPKGKKGGQKRIVDPFTRKEWYDIKAPAVFQNRNVGKTIVNRTAGNKIASDSLKGRIVPASLADLNKDEDQAARVIKLRIEDVVGRNCLTNFYGMDLTTDRLRSLVRKWQTLIESHVDVKTTDGYVLRLFCIGFTRRMSNQNRKTTYAQSSQVKQIRKKMTDIMAREATSATLKDLVLKFVPNSIGKSIEKECHGIYPLHDVFIRKVKLIKSPKFDAFKLAEAHGDGGESAAPAAAEAPAAAATEDTGAKV